MKRLGTLRQKITGNWLKLRKLPQFIAERAIPITPAGLRAALNRRRILALRDRHHGRRCFVIGNGPSLSIADLDRLQGEITIASNKIYLAFAQTAWRPTYVTVIDEILAQNNREAIRAIPLPKIYSREAAAFLEPDPRAVIVRTLPHPSDAAGHETLGFSDDLARGVHGGYSVLYLSLQAAATMGMTEIYLIGVDFSFALAPSTGESTACSGEVLRSQGEQNHFHPDYRKPGETWTYPSLDKQRAAFKLARHYFESKGGRLLNASRKTELDVLDRIALDDVLQDGVV